MFTVGIRQLTEDEESRLLTQEEVDNLENGTKVYIKWSGGNGPHLYTIKVDKYGYRRVDTCYADTITFVGKEHYHTRVFRAKE